MDSIIVGQYQTQSGQDGLTVKRYNTKGKLSWSYMGKWGAGSGSDEAEVRQRVQSIIKARRRVRVVQEF